jgi:hypothetical protein
MSDIQVRLSGGLGNQLFQWAYGLCLQQQGHDVSYDASFYDMDFSSVHNTRREYLLPSVVSIPPVLTTDTHDRCIIHDTSQYICHEFDHDKRYRLIGWWQSEKYFQSIKSTIHEQITCNEEHLKLYDFDQSCSLHVRRTDYVDKYSGKYPTMSPTYYQQAIEIVNPDGHIYVFSDDIQWCVDNIKHDQCVYVEHGTDVDQLFAMRSCEHNILANSSYSWWAGWLNTNPDKKIIMPDTIERNRAMNDYYMTGSIVLPIA